jgi:hypothetical protein
MSKFEEAAVMVGGVGGGGNSKLEKITTEAVSTTIFCNNFCNSYCNNYLLQKVMNHFVNTVQKSCKWPIDQCADNDRRAFDFCNLLGFGWPLVALP